jgi:carbohydrate kinase (thermoresistant glucokinase family)
MVYVLMGVAGCGKSTVGRVLSKKLVKPFFDADDYHPWENVIKMKREIALNDMDRGPWLLTLNQKICEWNNAGGGILACSALKEKHRCILAKDNDVLFVVLEGSKELIAQRLSARKEHYFSNTLLQSQFECYERPAYGMKVSIAQSVEEICQQILECIRDL